jgi:hypothetical protein
MSRFNQVLSRHLEQVEPHLEQVKPVVPTRDSEQARRGAQREAPQYPAAHQLNPGREGREGA